VLEKSRNQTILQCIECVYHLSPPKALFASFEGRGRKGLGGKGKGREGREKGGKSFPLFWS